MWHHLYLDIRLPLLVWEQTITHAFKAKPSCQVSAQSLLSIKSGEGSVAAATPRPKLSDRSCLSHKSATANRPPQPMHNMCTTSICQRHFVSPVRKYPAAQDLQGCIAKEVPFQQNSPTHFSCMQTAWGGVKCGSRRQLCVTAKRDAESQGIPFQCWGVVRNCRGCAGYTANFLACCKVSTCWIVPRQNP